MEESCASYFYKFSDSMEHTAILMFSKNILVGQFLRILIDRRLKIFLNEENSMYADYFHKIFDFIKYLTM